MAQTHKNSYNVNFKLKAVEPAEKVSKQEAAHQFGVEAQYSMQKGYIMLTHATAYAHTI